ncbi:MAG: transposase [Candidatus Brocadiales bacterium]
MDPSIIEAEKREAMMTYLGFKGYRPVIATLKETGTVIAYEFKKGNDNGGRAAIVKKAFSKMTKTGKEIREVLLDSEYYTNEVIDYLTEKGIKWAIGVDKDRGVMETIKSIPEADWKPPL